MANAFNEWMREYTEDPSAFEATFKTVEKFLAAGRAGLPPSYGTECLGLLKAYHRKLTAPAASAAA